MVVVGGGGASEGHRQCHWSQLVERDAMVPWPCTTYTELAKLGRLQREGDGKCRTYRVGI